MKKILLITAVWCPSCLIMRPRYQTLTREFDKISLEEIDFDENPSLIKQHHIGHVLPTAIIFDETGQERTRLIGEVPMKKLLETLRSL